MVFWMRLSGKQPSLPQISGSAIPTIHARSELSTEVMVTYDDKFLYVAAVCHAKTHKDYVSRIP